MANAAATTTMAVTPAAPPPPSPPRRFIYNDADLQAFLESPVKRDFLRFVAAMGQAVSSSSFTYDPDRPLRGLTPAMASLHGSLQVMKEWVDEIPPLSNTTSAAHIRFGNPAFRDWHARLVQRARPIVATMLRVHHEHQAQQPDHDDGVVGIEYDEVVLQAAMEQGRAAAAAAAAAPATEKTDPNDETITADNAVVVTTEELACYLEDAFGHPIRLDYGTGHECSLQVFLFTACRLHLCGSNQTQPPTANRLKAICLSIYHVYLSVTRQLQDIYRLEPAGSHGVWGLDDYYCLTFYFGACQLSSCNSHRPMNSSSPSQEDDAAANDDDNNDDALSSPRAIHDVATVRRYQDRYLYFGGIYFIQQIKKNAPFAESSPMLNDISLSLPTWDKVATGLLKLFEGEVLKKRPVVQHFRFGHIFRATWTPSAAPSAPPSTTFHHQHPQHQDFTAITKAPWAK
jgi:serine/threonine-protein phosphatase 2A activator